MSTEVALPDSRDVERTVALLAALAHAGRLVVLLALARSGPLPVGRLQALAGMEQSATSHQLRVLREARLVRAERRGKQVFYELHDHHVARILEDAVLHTRES